MRASDISSLPRRSSAGVTLTEVVVVLLILSVGAVAALPAWRNMNEIGQLRSASHSLASAFRRLRLQAVSERRSLAVVFIGLTNYSVYRDGDHDGVRSADIAQGIDKLVRGPFPVDGRATGVSVAILAEPPIPAIPPTGGLLAGLNDPIKFGPDDIVGCSYDGTCSSGTVYLSLPSGRMAAVRLRGATGRVVFWRFDAGQHRWIQTW